MKALWRRVAAVAGYDAARDGRPPEDCPYPHGDRRRPVWEAAYWRAVEGRREARRELRRQERADRRQRRTDEP